MALTRKHYDAGLHEVDFARAHGEGPPDHQCLGQGGVTVQPSTQPYQRAPGSADRC
jgi:hypothetical protein